MTRKLLWAGLAGFAGIAGFSLGSAPAQAAACATLTASPGSLQFTSWNPLDGQAQDLPLTLTVQRLSAATKSVRVLLTDVDTPSRPLLMSFAPGMRYEIVDVASGAQIALGQNTQVATSGVALRPFGNGSSNVIGINARVRIFGNTGPVVDYVGGKSYTQSFFYSVQCMNAQGALLAQDTMVPASFTVTVPIPRLVSIVTAQPAVIDFGNFTSIRQQVNITVRSTSSLSVTATTQNNGKFVLEGTPQPWPAYATIPYNMYFAGRYFAPGGGALVTSRAGVSGRDIPFELALAQGLPNAKLAGTYSDIITLTVTPGQ